MVRSEKIVPRQRKIHSTPGAKHIRDPWPNRVRTANIRTSRGQGQRDIIPIFTGAVPNNTENRRARHRAPSGVGDRIANRNVKPSSRRKRDTHFNCLGLASSGSAQFCELPIEYRLFGLQVFPLRVDRLQVGRNLSETLLGILNICDSSSPGRAAAAPGPATRPPRGGCHIRCTKLRCSSSISRGTKSSAVLCSGCWQPPRSRCPSRARGLCRHGPDWMNGKNYLSMPSRVSERLRPTCNRSTRSGKTCRPKSRYSIGSSQNCAEPEDASPRQLKCVSRLRRLDGLTSRFAMRSPTQDGARCRALLFRYCSERHR